jgi:hypothetical protein
MIGYRNVAKESESPTLHIKKIKSLKIVGYLNQKFYIKQGSIYFYITCL